MRNKFLSLLILAVVTGLLSGCSVRSESNNLSFLYTEEIIGESPAKVINRIISTGTLVDKLRFEKPNTGYWIYVSGKSLPHLDTHIRVTPGLIHDLKVYEVNDATSEVVRQSMHVGRYLPIRNWTHIHPKYIISTVDANGVQMGQLMRLEMKNVISASLLSYTEENSRLQEEIDNFIFYSLLGVMLVLIVVVLTILKSTKDTRYGWLAVALTALTVIEISAQGYGHVYLWGNLPELSIRGISLASAVFMIAYIKFSTLSLPRKVADINPIKLTMHAARYLTVILLVNVIFGEFHSAVPLLSATSLIFTLSIVGLNIIYIKSESYFARLILLGQIVIAGVGTFRLLDIFGAEFVSGVNSPLFRESEYMLVWVLLILSIFFFITAHIVGENVKLTVAQKSALDILESKVLERTKELEASKNESLKLGALQRDFLATMSHELRTPLSSIIGLSRMLRKNKDADLETMKRDIGVMERMAFHILNMVEDGLDFVRNRRLTNSNKIKAVELRAMCRDIISIGEWLSQNQKNTFKFTQSREMPTTLLFDERKVRQIVINFLSNAGRYCENGEIQCNISFYAGIPPLLKFDISDNGRGMETVDLEKYLHPFVKSRDSIGLGLGLAITKDLIDQMGGTLSIKSTPGVGTHVSFEVKVESSFCDTYSVVEDLESTEQNSYADTIPMCIDEMSDASISKLDKLRKLLSQGRISEAEDFISNLSLSLADDLHAERFISNARRFLNNLELDLLIDYIDKTSTSNASKLP